MKKFLSYLRMRPLGMVSLITLILLYLMMIFAEFAAPYSPGFSFPDQTYHPPNLRFYGGKFRAQEYRIINTVNWKYVRIRDLYENVSFFGRGEAYKLFGIIPADRHLFTVKPGGYPVFLLGADHLGRDLFSRIVYGSRISLTIGFIASALSLFLAMLFGGLSGYFGGKTDWTIMRAAEFLMLIPSLYLILFLRSIMASSMDSGRAYMIITVILSLVGWPGSARTIRGMVHAIKREEFIQNAQLEMIPPAEIIFRHIIPQIASLLIVSVALSVPGFIMTETTLSYLGLGIADPAVSWGSLIKREISTLSNLKAYPWLLNPVWFLLGVTLAFNFLGDALRDYFDPYHTIFYKITWPWKKGKKEPGVKSEELGVTSGEGARDAASSLLPPPHSSPFTLHPSLPTPHSSLVSFLSVKNLSVTFSVLRGRERISVKAVRGISFNLEKGEILGIVGESGSGKSVTTQAIPSLLPGNASASGSVLYEGKELLGLPVKDLREYRGKEIGMIFQEPGRSYDPLQNMESVFFETFRNSFPEISREEARERAAALLKETGLDGGFERLHNFPHQFSGGQLQRIGIALALAQGCELLIADEPTTALDVTIQKQIAELLKSLQQSRKISIIFISHDIDLVADISGRILVMYGGLVMESGTAAELVSSPLHPYTRALLAASPRFGSHYSRGRLEVIPGRVTDPSRPEPGCPFAPRCSQARPECGENIPALSATGDSHDVRCVAYRV